MGAMTKITISCPITWWERCKWIETNCKNYKDTTNWGMWQISQDDIYYLLEDKDAIMFALKWT